tara:strand:- start:1440 stop:1592 length:153 start_codon:yes stop_codon:yes gene_type:complete
VLIAQYIDELVVNSELHLVDVFAGGYYDSTFLFPNYSGFANKLTIQGYKL